MMYIIVDIMNTVYNRQIKCKGLRVCEISILKYVNCKLKNIERK